MVYVYVSFVIMRTNGTCSYFLRTKWGPVAWPALPTRAWWALTARPGSSRTFSSLTPQSFPLPWVSRRCPALTVFSTCWVTSVMLCVMLFVCLTHCFISEFCVYFVLYGMVLNIYSLLHFNNSHLTSSTLLRISNCFAHKLPMLYF